jgi:Kef-type K+ transport system membrane component KefB
MESAAHLGIVLLMFLIGLNLKLEDLIHLFKKTALLTIATSSIFAGAITLILLTFGFPLIQSMIAGIALMFSSTVIGFKLIPTTDLHNKRIGEVMISVLLFQDIIAILIILVMISGTSGSVTSAIPMIFVKAALFTTIAFGVVKFGIMRLFIKFDVIQEYIFILSLGWCFLTAEGASYIGLSQEIGAFIGGISLGITPIASVIAEKLKPIREFFLILFFFAIGARFDLHFVGDIAIPAILIAIVIVLLKPIIFDQSFRIFGESRSRSKELGIRLGIASEFSLLVTTTAIQQKLISSNMASLIQLSTIITFMISTYIVVMKYDTPISVNSKSRRD